jgi:ribosomal protein S18 acetylase RimI-like enzyme
MHVRQFDWDRDLKTVLALWGASGPGVQLSPSDEPEELRKKLERDPDLFLVAEDKGGQMIGAVLGGYDGRRGLVYHLAVETSHRRQGIGRMLMEALEERLKQKGCYKSYLLVAPDNDAALVFYNEQGWEEMPHHIMGKVMR